MKILLASSEIHPYSKTGGLADMVGALGKALTHSGCQVGLVTPLYQGIRERFPDISPIGWKLGLPLGARRMEGEILALKLNDLLTVYFVDQPEFYQRSGGLYQNGDADYGDNLERFLFFSKAVVRLARDLPWQPEIVHLHDWQVGLVPLLIRHERLTTGWGTVVPRTCMTIHNLAYQGVFPGQLYPLANLPWDYFTPGGVEFYGGFNCLKAGISLADTVTAVSPRYAREITTPEFGCALDGLLRRRRHDLFGILNGADYDEWNTTDNPHLKAPYSVENMGGKRVNKLELQREMGLPEDETAVLFGTICRLVDQKGVDIQLGALEEMLGANIQFVLLGSGAKEYERAYRELARRHPSKVAVHIGYDHSLSHRIEAGCDFFLMPSRFEPCGLNQMYSLRYGTVPIVRITGGLDDTVTDIAEDLEKANGIKFVEYSSPALAKAIRKALALFGEPALLAHYRMNGMKADFSWDKTAREYLAAYKR